MRKRNLKLTLGVLGVCAFFLLVNIFTSDRSPAGGAAKPAAKEPNQKNLAGGAAASDSATGNHADSEYVDPLLVLYQDYERAQKKYLSGLITLIGKERKDLAKVADVRNRVEYLELSTQSERLQYLLEHKPERIVRDRGLRRFVEVDWSEDDQLSLEVEKPQAAVRKRNLAALKSQLISFDEIDDLREYLRDELPKHEEHQQLASVRDEVFEKVTAQLGANKSVEMAEMIVPARPVAEVLPASQGRFTGLAVRDREGGVYFTVAGEMMEIRYLEPREVEAYQKVEGEKDPGHVFWTRPKGSDRVELAGIRANDASGELLIVFNDEVPFQNGENAWARSKAFYSIAIDDTDRPPQLTSIAPDVIALVIEKCR